MKQQCIIGIYLYDSLSRKSGLGEFEYNLAQVLAERADSLYREKGVRLSFILHKDMVGHFGQQVDYVGLTKWRIKLLNVLPFLWRFYLPQPLDLVHLTHQGVKLHLKLATKELVTIHDVNFLHNGVSDSALRRKQSRFMRGVRYATHLSIISQFTAGDVCGHFDLGLPWRVILNGVCDLSQAPRDMQMSLPPNYLFHISRMDWKKNVHLLVKMMKYLPDYNLVLAGNCKKNYMSHLQEIVSREHLTNVVMLGPVTDEQKARLYHDCRAVAFPSLSEGFGLPVIEAMCFGKPVFCSRLTALLEVGGEAAFYFDELEPAEMAATVRACLNQPCDGLRQKTHAAQFNWQRAADEYLRYYLDILGC